MNVKQSKGVLRGGGYSGLELFHLFVPPRNLNFCVVILGRFILFIILSVIGWRWRTLGLNPLSRNPHAFIRKLLGIIVDHADGLATR